jgi:hypothetical protein
MATSRERTAVQALSVRRKGRGFRSFFGYFFKEGRRRRSSSCPRAFYHSSRHHPLERKLMIRVWHETS